MTVQWHKLNPKDSLVDAFGIPRNGKTSMTLKTALDNYRQLDGVEEKSRLNYWSSKIINDLDCKKSIDRIKVEDVNIMFQKVNKKVHITVAYRLRTLILNAIKYALTGQIPQQKESSSSPQPTSKNGSAFDTAKLRFSAAKIEDLAALLPIFGKTGRYAGIKANVQDMLNTLPEGQGGLVEAPKKFMDDKEAKSIISAVTHLWVKSKVKWSMKWNPIRSVFVLMRKSDLAKLQNKN